jgi:hypothetical protein
MSETLEAIGDRVSPERMVERRKAAIGQAAHKVRDTVMGSRDYEEPRLTHLREQAGSAMSSAADRVQHAPDMVAEQARGNPLAAGLVAFGAGMLLATLFPETAAEHRMLDAAQPQMALAAEELKEAGRDLAEDAKQHGQDAAAELKSAGSDAAASVTQQLQSTSSGPAQRQAR